MKDDRAAFAVMYVLLALLLAVVVIVHLKLSHSIGFP